jgi:hypothetical protein
MIDALYTRYAKHKEKPLDPNYQPHDAIQAKKLINPQADKLAVIFPGWHTHKFPINILAKRLAKRGWAVLYYDFHDQILEPDEDVVVESFRVIRDTISKEIQELLTKHDYLRVHFISVSMGGVPMALVCDKFSHFTSVTAVVGGDNLAINMWYGLRTDHYRRAFEKMHVGVRRLAKDWDILAPEKHLRHFKGKPIKFVMSLHDNFVRTKYQKRLAERLQEAGAQITIKRRFSGHMVTILRYCLFDNPI